MADTYTEEKTDLTGQTKIKNKKKDLGDGTYAEAVMQVGSDGSALDPGTVKFAKVQLSATGTIVAAVVGKKIRVLSAWLSCAGTVNAKWQSHVTPTDLTGLLYGVANSGIVLPYNPKGWFETVAGEALDLALSASVAIGGCIAYVEVS